MEYDTDIGHVVPNISQALHSFNIFEGTHAVASGLGSHTRRLPHTISVTLDVMPHSLLAR